MAASMPDVAARLRALRKQRGITLEVLAGLSGVSISYLSMVENGNRTLNTYSTIVGIASALNVPPAELAPGMPDGIASSGARGRDSVIPRPVNQAALDTSSERSKAPNLILRRVREQERQESRSEFAEAMARAAREMGEPVEPGERYVARLEDGDIRYPNPVYRRVLTRLCGRSMTELGFVRISDTNETPDVPARQIQSVPETAADITDSEPSGQDNDEEVMRRRAFLLNMAILAEISRSDPITALETVRRELENSFSGRHAGSAGVDEWNEIALEYGETYPITAPAELLKSLTVDFAGLQDAFQRYPHDADRQELYRASAFLAGFVAQTVSNLGHVNQARRWWRTARYAADRSGDSSSALWVRGREIIHAMGERPVMSVLRLIEEAEQFTATASPELVLELLGGKAQTLAIAGRSLEAENTLTELRDRFSATSLSGYSGSLLAWGEERLHNTESFTYSRLGDDGKTETAQRAASAVYKHDPSNVRWPAGIKLNRAFCLVRNGDVTEGVAHAREAIVELPSAQQTRGVLIHGRDVLNAIPPPEQNRPIVSEYREWLYSTFRTPARQPAALHARVGMPESD